jgi:hypothetical protein
MCSCSILFGEKDHQLNLLIMRGSRPNPQTQTHTHPLMAFRVGPLRTLYGGGRVARICQPLDKLTLGRGSRVGGGAD